MRTKEKVKLCLELHGKNAEQFKYKFDNGLGASVVRHNFSYGHEDGLWELAVLNVDGSLLYDSPITDDVIGHLDQNAVDKILDKIEALKFVGGKWKETK